MNIKNHTAIFRIFVFLLIIIISISAQAQKTKIKDLFVNDSIPAIVELDKLKRMVEIDSITIKPEIMDAIDPDSLVYIGKTYFLYYKGNNTCFLSKVEFNKKIKSIRIDHYTFDNQSTFAELKSEFSSCSDLSDKISVHNDPLNYESCSIDIEDYNGSFLFFFHEKKLRLFFLWRPT